ncbi:anti-phage dCTP deaminase [Pantoea agglomerans]|uniref:Cytidine deaminase n=1 Tax=Enterobacter agglomerans TaxID=549 RepID=A0ACC5PSL4_ENTAG|nr:anti-phage dCTP deaminase [Pantoea agglomerans]MBD8127979.1 cytidine deaminase [Pantoea agglomerans]MBD8155743.1 cytidine deaminase [Pantoea agglomerans]MBD8244895.1 cytidine deaminase [Pantoea agglomerans]
MAEPAKKTSTLPQKSSNSSDKTSLEFIKTRQAKDIYIGLCGYVGCGMRTVKEILETVSTDWGYNVVHVRISSLLEGNVFFEKSAIENSRSNQKNRHLRLQEVANNLRAHYCRSELLAEAAIAAIKAEKNKINYNTDNYKGTVFIIDQFKRAEEVELFRVIYQHNFYLLGVLRDLDFRITNLIADDSTKDDLHNIINIDNKSGEKYGQRTGEAILDSDYFIKNNFSQKKDIKRKVDRLFGLIHGLNGLTPTINEKGMYAAFSASLQSACLSRQVGAALFDDEGNLLAVGKNDVPKAGGGLYGSDDLDNDHRCVHKSGKCYNDDSKNKIKKRIKDILTDGVMSSLGNLSNSSQADFSTIKLLNSLDEIAENIYSKSKISTIMEYSRSIHAEMDVITTMARKSNGDTKGKILFTTTYPCHNCARHIVAAGIKKVVYIEPFDKSLALDLHNDAITKNDESSLVVFADFEGVSPRRYSKFFRPTDERKEEDGSGVARKFNVKYKHHIDVQYLDDYRKYESVVAQKFINEVSKLDASKT